VPDVPHVAFPFSIQNGALATVQQDSIAEIAQNVLVALGTRIGSRIDAPEYGTPSELFSQLTPEPSVAAVLATAEEWEPRATLLSEIEVEELVERVQVKVGVAG
jgi:phage baseplate assembly protein W